MATAAPGHPRQAEMSYLTPRQPRGLLTVTQALSASQHHPHDHTNGASPRQVAGKGKTGPRPPQLGGPDRDSELPDSHVHTQPGLHANPFQTFKWYD